MYTYVSRLQLFDIAIESLQYTDHAPVNVKLLFKVLSELLNSSHFTDQAQVGLLFKNTWIKNTKYYQDHNIQIKLKEIIEMKLYDINWDIRCGAIEFIERLCCTVRRSFDILAEL
jgi:hypothetical protein